MLQQVSQLAPPAPQDRGPATGEAMAAGGLSQADGGDFLAMLAQAEAQEGIAPSVVIAPAEMSIEDGTAGEDGSLGKPAWGMAGFVPAMPVPSHQDTVARATGHEDVASSDAILRDGDRPGEGGGDLMNGALPDPVNAAPPGAPSTPATATQQPASVSPLALSATSQPTVTVAQAAIVPPPLLPQEEVTQSDVSPAALGLLTMDRPQAPAAGIGLAAKVPSGDLAGHDRPAEAWASDLHSEAGDHAAARDPADEAPPAFIGRSEAYPAQSTGPAPASMAGPLPPEGRGLSALADQPMTAAGSLAAQVGPAPSSPAAAAGLALPYQRLHHPQLAAQVAPAVLAMGVAPGADGGPGRLTVAIRPAELGTLQIIADKTDDKTARIAVLAERPETLQLLMRDAPTLEAALRAAGVGEGGGLSLTFGLASQGQGDRGGDPDEQAGHAAGPGGAAPPNPVVIAGGIVMARTSLIDLSL